jgi:hypothetical protein
MHLVPVVADPGGRFDLVAQQFRLQIRIRGLSVTQRLFGSRYQPAGPVDEEELLFNS